MKRGRKPLTQATPPYVYPCHAGKAVVRNGKFVGCPICGAPPNPIWRL